MKKLLLFLTILFFPLLVIAKEPETKATQAIVIDYDTSEVIFEKDPDELTFPSSMTKLMTAYILFDLLENDTFQDNDKFKVSKNAWKQPGSRMFLNEGSEVSIESLLKGLIISSGNDAAVAIAEGVSGSEKEFVKLMNEKAKELNLKKSHFNNASGLGTQNHQMTVREIALLSQLLIKNHNDAYKKYYSRKEFTYNGITQQNRNLLLKEYEGTDGVKTGHTDMGGYGMSASAVKDGRRIIVVVNGLKSERERADETKKLLKYALEDCRRVKIFKANKEIGKADVWLGKKKQVSLALKEDIDITIEKDLINKITAEIEYRGPIEAPIIEGDVVAKLIIYIPDKEEKLYLLYANENVNEINFFERVFFLIKYKTSNAVQKIKNIFIDY